MRLEERGGGLGGETATDQRRIKGHLEGVLRGAGGAAPWLTREKRC